MDRAPYDPAGIARQWAAVIAAPPRNALLKTVHCPALVIHGDAIRCFPSLGGKTRQSIAGAELVVVPGMGHDVPESLVPVYLKHIGDFVSKVEARAPIAG